MEIATGTIRISKAKHSDIAAMLQLYGHYVMHSFASLEEEAPSEMTFSLRMKEIFKRELPIFVAKKSGKLVGFIYAAPFKERSAYRYTLEQSIYVAPNFTGEGIGSKLLKRLLAECRRKGYQQLVASIVGNENVPSIQFHQKHGYIEAGRIRHAGFKFGKWVDVVFMQHSLTPLIAFGDPMNTASISVA